MLLLGWQLHGHFRGDSTIAAPTQAERHNEDPLQPAAAESDGADRTREVGAMKSPSARGGLLYRAGKKIATLRGKRIVMTTQAAETVVLGPEGGDVRSPNE
jgi:hypothetical protein